MSICNNDNITDLNQMLFDPLPVKRLWHFEKLFGSTECDDGRLIGNKVSTKVDNFHHKHWNKLVSLKTNEIEKKYDELRILFSKFDPRTLDLKMTAPVTDINNLDFTHSDEWLSMIWLLAKKQLNYIDKKNESDGITQPYASFYEEYNSKNISSRFPTTLTQNRQKLCKTVTNKINNVLSKYELIDNVELCLNKQHTGLIVKINDKNISNTTPKDQIDLLRVVMMTKID